MKNHPQTGDIVLKYDINAIKRSVRNLVSTNLYERPFKPSIGVNLRGMLFELDTAHTLVLENEIKDLIHGSIQQYKSKFKSSTKVVYRY
jgi:phage baseplate assembly protein W